MTQTQQRKPSLTLARAAPRPSSSCPPVRTPMRVDFPLSTFPTTAIRTSGSVPNIRIWQRDLWSTKEAKKKEKEKEPKREKEREGSLPDSSAFFVSPSAAAGLPCFFSSLMHQSITRSHESTETTRRSEQTKKDAKEMIKKEKYPTKTTRKTIRNEISARPESGRKSGEKVTPITKQGRDFQENDAEMVLVWR